MKKKKEYEAPPFKHLSSKPITDLGESPQLNTEFYSIDRLSEEEKRDRKKIGAYAEGKISLKKLKNKTPEEQEGEKPKKAYRKTPLEAFKNVPPKIKLVYLAHLAGMPTREIEKHIRGVSKSSVGNYLKEVNEQYPDLEKILNRLTRGVGQE